MSELVKLLDKTRAELAAAKKEIETLKAGKAAATVATPAAVNVKETYQAITNPLARAKFRELHAAELGIAKRGDR
jgi:hypothetical protein